MANAFAQIGAVTAMNVRNIPERWASSLVAVVGIGGVTLVLIAVLSIAAGFKQALEFSGSEDVAIILRSGSTNEMSRVLRPGQGHTVTDAPGIKKDARTSPCFRRRLYVLTEAQSSRARNAAATCRSAVCRPGTAVAQVLQARSRA